MKTFIKNAGLFLAGGATFMYLLSKGVTENILHPKEGTVVYEDDKMRVVNVGNKNNKLANLAGIVYKNQTTNEES